MSVQFYHEMETTATELLNEFGVRATINHQAGGKSSVSVVFAQKDKAAVEPSNPLQLVGEDVVCFVSGSARKPPQVGDLVVAEKRQFTISQVDTIRPGSVTVIYRLVGSL